MKFILLVISAALVILSVYLFRYNLGSQKIFASVFVGLGSFVAATYFILQPEIFSKNFGVTVALYDSNKPASFIGTNMNIVEVRQQRLANIVHFYENNLVKDQVIDKLDNKLIPELLEYAVIEDLLMFNRPSERFGSKDRGDGVREVSYLFKNSNDYQTFYDTKVSTFSHELNKNRFFSLNLFSWDIQEVALPKGTQIALIQEEGVRGLHIWKNKFFDIGIKIREPSMKNGKQNSVPIGFRSSKKLSEHISTVNFEISLRADFNPISSENPETENNKDWVKSLFEYLEKTYSDSNNKEVVLFD